MNPWPPLLANCVTTAKVKLNFRRSLLQTFGSQRKKMSFSNRWWRGLGWFKHFEQSFLLFVFSHLQKSPNDLLAFDFSALSATFRIPDTKKREIIWPAFCLFLILPLFSPIGSNDQTRRCGALPVQGWLRLEGAEHHQVQLRPVEWSDPALRAGLLPVSGIHPGWKGRIFLFFWIIFLMKKYLCFTEALKFVTPNDINISWRFSRLKEGFEPLTTRMVFQTSTITSLHWLVGAITLFFKF